MEKSKINNNRTAATDFIVFKYLEMNAEPAIEIKFDTADWYHVVNLKTRKCWGFKVEKNIVTDCPYEYREFLLGRIFNEDNIKNPNLIVTKGATQYVRERT